MAIVTDSTVASQIPAVEFTAVERKKTKDAKEPKVAKAAALKKAKSSPSHPPFLQMITDAIVALKERTGSSQYAITKFNEEKYKQLPSSFRKLLLFHLKKSVASGKLVKVKNSFKLAPTRSTPVKPATAPAKKSAAGKPKENKPKAAKTAAAKPKPKAKAVTKPKAAAKPKADVSSVTKTKTAGKRKAKTVEKPAKVAKRTAQSTPGKKAVKPKKVAAKSVRKPKSVKSPAKRGPARKAKK